MSYEDEFNQDDYTNEVILEFVEDLPLDEFLELLGVANTLDLLTLDGIDVVIVNDGDIRRRIVERMQGVTVNTG